MGYKIGDCIIFNKKETLAVPGVGMSINSEQYTGTIIRIEFNPVFMQDNYYVETAAGERFVVRLNDIVGLEKDLFTVNADDIKYKGLQGALNDNFVNVKAKTWHIQIPTDIKEVSIDLSDEHYILPIDTIIDIIKKYAKKEEN